MPGNGPICGPFGLLGASRASPTQPCPVWTLLFPRFRAQARLCVYLSGLLAQKGGTISRCSSAPDSPLHSLHISPTLPIGLKHPSSPLHIELYSPPLTCLSCAVWQGQDSTFFSRDACCADAPACRHGLGAQGAHFGAQMHLFSAFCVLVGPGPCRGKKGAFAWPWGRIVRSNMSILVLNDLS